MASVALADHGPADVARRLYEVHSEWLLRFCTRQLHDRGDAEDAVQTTFLYAFRALRKGVVPDCEQAWLTTIARNVCRSHRRTRQRHPEDPAELDIDRIGLAQPELEEVGFLDDVRAALASLPENQRRALVLREWHGVASNEIATELHLSEPATHALLTRARRSFETAMSASRRPFAGLNAGILLDQLRTWAKPLLAGAGAKAAIVTTAAGVAVGVAVVEHRAGEVAPSPAAPAASVPERSAPEVTPPVVESRAEKPKPHSDRRPRTRAAVPVAGGPRPAAEPVDTVVRVSRPPRAAVPSSDPTPPAAGEPTPPPPVASAPPPTLPVPPPVELPPVLGEEPPVALPPLVDELVPPVEPPPLPPLPGPPLPLP